MKITPAGTGNDGARAPARTTCGQGTKVLVTGGTGFIGTALVKHLLSNGWSVRVLARQRSRVEPLEAMGAEIYRGDVADQESFGRAFVGCEVVVHLAAGTSGSERDSQTATLQGTRNVIELCHRHKPKRLVYISSCSVYGVADCPTNTVVSETSPLERLPELRGRYSASKQEAEGYVTDYMKSDDVPVVVLRPGSVYGPGGELYTPMMGFSAGSVFVVIGTGGLVLPLVYVDNLVDAVELCMTRSEAVGEIFNVVDGEPVTKRRYINEVVRRAVPGAHVLYVPYALLYGVTWLQEILFRLIKRRPVLTRYRLESSQKRVVYAHAKLAGVLGWTSKVDTRSAFERLVAMGGPGVRQGTDKRAPIRGRDIPVARAGNVSNGR